MQYYDELATYEREGFTIVVDKTYEDMHPRDCFETDDVDEIVKDIDRGHLEWFLLRVRVLVEGLEQFLLRVGLVVRPKETNVIVDEANLLRGCAVDVCRLGDVIP